MGHEDDESSPPVCPKCKTKTVYTRTDGSRRCYKCGMEIPSEGGDVSEK